MNIVVSTTLLFASYVHSAVVCKPIPKTYNSTDYKITETDGGIFSLESFGTNLYIGMFGYDYNDNSNGTGDDPMIWRYNGSSISAVSPGLDKDDLHVTLGDQGSESICALKSFGGHLYAGTERRGIIFRSSNGTHWDAIGGYAGPDQGICDFEDDNTTLAALLTRNLPSSNGQLTYSDNPESTPITKSIPTNWSTKDINHSNTPYFRESIYFKNHWYIFGKKTTGSNSHKPIAFKSVNNDLSGAWIDISSALPNPGRIFRTNIIKGELWAGTGDNSIDTHVALLKYNGSTFEATKRILSTTYSHINKPYHVKIDGEDRIIATASTGWKPLDGGLGKQGKSKLLEFDMNGNLMSTLCTFDEEYAEATAFYGDNFYVGTMRGGYEVTPHRGSGYGRLYKIGGITEVQSNILFIEYDDYLIPIIN